MGDMKNKGRGWDWTTRLEMRGKGSLTGIMEMGFIGTAGLF